MVDGPNNGFYMIELFLIIIGKNKSGMLFLQTVLQIIAMKSNTFRLSSVDICRYSYRVAFMLTGRLFVLSDYSQRAEVNEERESSAAAA